MFIIRIRFSSRLMARKAWAAVARVHEGLAAGAIALEDHRSLVKLL